MKKLACSIIGIVILIGIICVTNIEENSYLRIHIRANSNSEYDQNIKYKVKDKVVEALTPLAKDITSKKSMIKILKDNLEYLETVVDTELAVLGQNYTSNIKIAEEQFPTRSYEELTLESGVYDALIIELGTGQGDNWWCVAFPPLCFVATDNGTDSVEYKSKIKELIDKYCK